MFAGALISLFVGPVGARVIGSGKGEMKARKIILQLNRVLWALCAESNSMGIL